jgi:hypothetical protein
MLFWLWCPVFLHNISAIRGILFLKLQGVFINILVSYEKLRWGKQDKALIITDLTNII